MKLYSRANMQTDWSAVSASDEDENDVSNSIAVFTHLRSLLKVKIQFQIKDNILCIALNVKSAAN